MKASGLFLGGSATSFTRNFRVGANLTNGQVACMVNGIVSNPASNVSYANAVGIVMDQTPATYTTTQATGVNTANRFVRVTCHPNQKYIGRVSSAAAAWAAIAAAANGAILTNSTASSGGTVISDTNVGTANYVAGLAIGLTGNNKGYSRVITATTANVSATVTVPFDFAIAANDTFIRTFNIAQLRGVVLTDDFKDFLQTAAGETIPSNANVTGGTLVVDVYVDGSKACGSDGRVTIINSTPVVEVEGIFSEHVWKRLA